MPFCSCVHEYQLSATAANEFLLLPEAEGTLDLKAVLDRTGLIDSVTVRQGFYDYGSMDLTGVRNIEQLSGFLDLLKSTIFVDLTPEVDECYALGPYTVFEENESERGEIGELVNRAKYWREDAVVDHLGQRISSFVEQHPSLSKVQALAVPPKSDSNTPNLARSWAMQLRAGHDWDVISVVKTRETEPQKTLGEEDTERDAALRVLDSVRVDQVKPGTRILILDDTIRSGGTIKELARALRAVGAGSIYGLAVAKDAKFTNGGMGLDKAKWS